MQTATKSLLILAGCCFLATGALAGDNPSRTSKTAETTSPEPKKMVSHEGERVSERRLTKAYGVRGFPTFWFLDSEGKRIGPAPGYKPTSSFLPLLRYVGGNHYKTMSYESFLKKETGQG
jgi:thioredoxin-related protein